jgi:hypothetical protein
MERPISLDALLDVGQRIIHVLASLAESPK